MVSLPDHQHSRTRVVWTLLCIAATFLTKGWIVDGVWGGRVRDAGKVIAWWIVHPEEGP